MVLLLATLLLDQVGRGLVEAKESSALSEAGAGALQAQVRLDTARSQNPLTVEALLQQVVQGLGERGASGDLFDVVLAGPPRARAFASGDARPDDVPAALVRRLETASSAFLYTRGEDSDVLVVGTRLETTTLGTYRLVHLFPLTDEEETYALVRRTAAAAGLLLVGLLALGALLVTRQVVSPVRLAARTAERLAAGRLEERMAVRGEDELALLALSFNTMAASLQDQIRRLEDLSLVQRRFVSDVSHELRTPLTTVRMAAEVLYEERDTFPRHVARSAELLQAELDRFEELLVDLLEISRYDAGAASLDAEPLDLVALADRVLSSAEPLARARGSVLVLRSDGPVVAEVDQVRMERVLRNLVVNAVEHGEGRPVEVHVRGTGTVAGVLVRDQGVGLQPGHSELVFTRFWRGDPSRARTTGGTGLGLAIALEDVRLHGGWLQAAGEPGYGSVFRMTLTRRAGRSVTNTPLELPRGGS